ncbi:hypothetical protein ET445_08725 [Agromyces protaetiae]|uniref:Uncharacterized protein n=1 Tax=Agromyces protaetiae TaxID=2509455 RepID=A0A4V0YH43_9MICO|nr:hypothetical protein [Agromyces protaetiae]QAY73411.1 hypothetical protein ET445_08725 [Agromyces protaetiae]
MSEEMPPELAYGSHDDDLPVRGGRRQRVLRVVVLIALAALVLPLVLSLYAVAMSAAERACRVTVVRFDDHATGSRVALEFFGPGGPGWLCYAERESGGDRLLANLGLIPGAPRTILPGEQST